MSTVINTTCQVYLETDPDTNIFQYNLFIEDYDTLNSRYILLVYYKNSKGHIMHNVSSNSCEVCTFDGYLGTPIVIPIDLGFFPTNNQTSTNGQLFQLFIDHFLNENDANSGYGSGSGTVPRVRKPKQLAYKASVANPMQTHNNPNPPGSGNPHTTNDNINLASSRPNKNNNKLPDRIAIGNLTFITKVGRTKPFGKINPKDVALKEKINIDISKKPKK